MGSICSGHSFCVASSTMLGGADDLLPPIQQPRFVQSVPETAIRKRDESLVSRLQPSRKGEIAYTRRVGNGHVCEDFVFPVGMPDLQAVLPSRSEEHTSELQSRLHLVCRLLLEKKKKQ